MEEENSKLRKLLTRKSERLIVGESIKEEEGGGVGEESVSIESGGGSRSSGADELVNSPSADAASANGDHSCLKEDDAMEPDGGKYNKFEQVNN